MNARSAFSLTEVVLALGVVAFAAVAILGLFPVALDTARESQRETYATLIARSLFADLRATMRVVPGIVPPAATATIGAGSNPVPIPGGEAFRLFDDTGEPLTSGTAPATRGDFLQPQAGAVYGARLASGTTATPGLYWVTVTVETPMQATGTVRKTYPFTTMVAP